MSDAEREPDIETSDDPGEPLGTRSEEAQSLVPSDPAAPTQAAEEASGEAPDAPEPFEAESPDVPEPSAPEPPDVPEPSEPEGPDVPEPSAPEPPEPDAQAVLEPAATDDGRPADSLEPAAAPPAAPPAPPDAVPEPARTVRRTVSEQIARQLHASGARYCFTVPAEPILTLLDDLSAVGIRVVTTRHEGGAAFMAGALAQSTGRPQVVAVSRAVGAANAAIGIHTAQQDSAPLVALAGQVASTLIGREAFQEADLVAGVGSMASWAAQIDTPEEALAILAKAQARLETGRPGPIVLSIPLDVQGAQIDLPAEQAPRATGARGPAADRDAVSRAMKLLAASERGVIVAGGGVLQSRATKRLVALSEAMALPVIAAWRRPDVFPNDHPNYLGMAGTAAAPTVASRLADADVIMFIGARLSEITTDGYAIPGPQTRWIHVDVQPRVAGSGLSAPTLSVPADASRFLDSAWSDLRAAALDNEMRSRRVARNAADREAYRAASAVGKGSWEGPGLHPGRLLAILRGVLPDNATITTDAGNLAAFVARGYRFRRAGTFLGATSGAMGFGLPAAIAASLLDPDRIAVAICGDGGFAMTMNELETAVREGAHPIAIVLDNRRYGTIAVQQAREGRLTGSTELGAIDFAAVARAHGALGFTATDEAVFRSALREAITSRQPSVIHVEVDGAWRSVDDNPTSAPA